MPTLPRQGWPKATHGQTRNPSVAAIARIYVRDRFACVYCGRWTVPTQMLRLVSHAFPAAFPFHPNWKMDITPRAYWDISTSLDHVRAVSMGGDHHDPTNLATACARCQYQKGNLPLEMLGWSPRRNAPGWSGLIDDYAPLWERLGRPNHREHSTWIRAFDGARAASSEQPPAV
jgi:5-methylcytosine-specific restriction endonuclease McrA